jgi:hypothetical protein
MAGGRQHTTEESAEKRKRVLGMAIEHLGCRRGLRGPRVCVRLLPTDRWLMRPGTAPAAALKVQRLYGGGRPSKAAPRFVTLCGGKLWRMAILTPVRVVPRLVRLRLFTLVV